MNLSLVSLSMSDIIKCFMNLPLVRLSMSDIIKIDVATVISLVLRINFAKIHTDSEVVISMT